MQWLPETSPIGRAILGLALFTFSFWALALAVFLAWNPGRSLAAAAVGRLVSHGAPAAGALATADSDGAPDTALCGDDHEASFGTDSESGGFTWAVMGERGDVTMNDGDLAHVHVHSPSGRPTFWFRDDSGEYWVDDPDLVVEVQRVTTPLREIGSEMGRVGAEMGRKGAAMGRIGGRMGAMGARLAMLEARLASRPVSQASRERAREAIRGLRAQMRALEKQLEGEQTDHARSQRELSRRMSELSARHQVVLRDVRVKLRDIARRARQQGKAERPHANA